MHPADNVQDPRASYGEPQEPKDDRKGPPNVQFYPVPRGEAPDSSGSPFSFPTVTPIRVNKLGSTPLELTDKEPANKKREIQEEAADPCKGLATRSYGACQYRLLRRLKKV